MQLGHTVDLVGANQGEVGHANHLRLRLLNDGDSTKELTIIGKVTLDKLQKIEVDVKDDLLESLLVVAVPKVCLKPTRWRGRRCCIRGTDHFSSASGRTVWLV